METSTKSSWTAQQCGWMHERDPLLSHAALRAAADDFCGRVARREELRGRPAQSRTQNTIRIDVRMRTSLALAEAGWMQAGGHACGWWRSGPANASSRRRHGSRERQRSRTEEERHETTRKDEQLRRVDRHRAARLRRVAGLHSEDTRQNSQIQRRVAARNAKVDEAEGIRTRY